MCVWKKGGEGKYSRCHQWRYTCTVRLMYSLLMGDDKIKTAAIQGSPARLATSPMNTCTCTYTHEKDWRHSHKDKATQYKPQRRNELHSGGTRTHMLYTCTCTACIHTTRLRRSGETKQQKSCFREMLAERGTVLGKQTIQ